MRREERHRRRRRRRKRLRRSRRANARSTRQLAPRREPFVEEKREWEETVQDDF